MSNKMHGLLLVLLLAIPVAQAASQLSAKSEDLSATQLQTQQCNGWRAPDDGCSTIDTSSCTDYYTKTHNKHHTFFVQCYVQSSKTGTSCTSSSKHRKKSQCNAPDF